MDFTIKTIAIHTMLINPMPHWYPASTTGANYRHCFSPNRGAK